MKRKYKLQLLLLWFIVPVYAGAQSNLLYDDGSIIEVTGTADICADQITINGGATGNGTKCGNSLPARTFTIIPFLEKFDYVTVPDLPTGWYIEDSNNDVLVWKTGTSNPLSFPNMLMYASGTEAVNDWFFSPAFDLTGGTTYEISFWIALASSGTHKLEVKSGTSGNSSGMSIGPLYSNSKITNTTHQKGSFVYTPSSTATYYFGWRCFSDAGSKPDFGVDDIQIRHQPASTYTQTIAASSTTPVEFTGTGVSLQFTTNNSGELQIQADRINQSPAGTLPAGVTNLLNRYWTLTVVSGSVNGVYCLSLNLDGAGGVTDYSTLRLLKRDNVNAAWSDIGVPSDITQAPIIKWCSDQLTGFSDFGIGGGNDNPLPVELTSFRATVYRNSVSLKWTTATEVGNYGFEIHRTPKNDHLILPGAIWKTIGFVQGAGNSNAPKNYSFNENNLQTGRYFYRLKQLDSDGSFKYSNVIEVDISKPETFFLEQNYPNPFNPATTIDFQIPSDEQVRLEIYTLSGERTATLINEFKTAGYYSAVIDNGKLNFSSGVYIYRLSAGGFSGIKKFVLMK